MAKACICPVCNGTGEVFGPFIYGWSTAAPSRVTCHGCGGLDWVVVPEQ